MRRVLGSVHLVGASAGTTTASYFSQFRSCILSSMLWDGLSVIVHCVIWETYEIVAISSSKMLEILLQHFPHYTRVLWHLICSLESEKYPVFDGERWTASAWVLWDVGGSWRCLMPKGFIVWLLSLQTIPFYIFSESYGGKMAAGIALALHEVSRWRM